MSLASVGTSVLRAAVFTGTSSRNQYIASQEGWFGQEEGRLTSQITIPGILVGRVIGKGGVNVRELQVTKITKKGSRFLGFYPLTLLLKIILI